MLGGVPNVKCATFKKGDVRLMDYWPQTSIKIGAILIAACLYLTACISPPTETQAKQDPVASAQMPDRPNILLVVFEDMGPRIGAYGDDVAKTPILDAFAAQSILYENVFTTAGVCAPSRSSLITGHYQQSIGTQHMRTATDGPQPYEAVPPSYVKALPELLRRIGYYTTNMGGYGPDHAKTDYQFGRPFTIWDEEVAQHPWRGRSEGQPFFSMVNVMGTHESQLWSLETEAKAPFMEGILAAIKYARADRVPTIDPDSVEVPSYLPDTPVVRRDIAQLYENVFYMEKQVADLLSDLEEDGLSESTIVIITTDHGDGLPRMKRSLYDSGLHVPMMVRLPTGEGAGTQREELVSFVDLAPTILSVAGADIPEQMPGRDLFSPAASGERNFVYAALDRHDEVPDRMRAARDKRWKYIRNYQPEEPFFRPHRFRDVLPTMAELWRLYEANQLTAVQAQYFKPQRSPEELYDTFNDPEEVVNLAENPAHRSDLLRMRAVLDEYMRSTRDYSDVSEAEMVEEMWPGGQQPITAAPLFEENGGKLLISVPTEGSSIGYRVQGDAAWSLYVSPIELPEQPIEAKAIRYGYRESEISIFRPN